MFNSDTMQKQIDAQDRLIQNLIQRVESLERRQAMNPLRGPDSMITAVGKYWRNNDAKVY